MTGLAHVEVIFAAESLLLRESLWSNPVNQTVPVKVTDKQQNIANVSSNPLSHLGLNET